MNEHKKIVRLNIVTGKSKVCNRYIFSRKVWDKSNYRRRERVEKFNECHVGLTCAPTRPARNLGMSVWLQSDLAQGSTLPRSLLRLTSPSWLCTNFLTFQGKSLCLRNRDTSYINQYYISYKQCRFFINFWI